MEKRGDLTEASHSDFDPSQKVKYADADSPYIAGEKDKGNLKTPVLLILPKKRGQGQED